MNGPLTIRKKMNIKKRTCVRWRLLFVVDVLMVVVVFPSSFQNARCTLTAAFPLASSKRMKKNGWVSSPSLTNIPPISGKAKSCRSCSWTLGLSSPSLESSSNENPYRVRLGPLSSSAYNVSLPSLRQPISSETNLILPLIDSTAIDVEINKDKNEVQRQKAIMIGLLWTTALLSALDRVAMSVALVPMTEEYGFTDGVKGSISSLFSFGYGIFILPAGLIIAQASPRLLMSLGIGVWSLATWATPFAATAEAATSAPVLLLFARACVGAAESVVLPTVQRLLVSWTTPEEKSFALATVFTGFQTGTIAAYLLSPLIMDFFSGNWRVLFFVYGTLGLALLVPWLTLAKDKPQNKPELQQLLDQPRGQTVEPENGLMNWREAPWRELLQSKAVWGMTIAHAAKNWGLYNTLAWTPTFYYEQYGIGVSDSAILSILPSVTGAAACLVAGNLADKCLLQFLDRSEKSLTLVRKVFQTIALMVPALVLMALAVHIPEDAEVAKLYFMALIGFQAFYVAGFEAGNQDKAGEKWAGLLYSVTSLPPVLFGTFGVWFVGQVLDATHQDWSIVFAMNAVVNVLGAAAFLLLYNSKREFN